MEVWPSGQRQQTVNLPAERLRWFESIHLHQHLLFDTLDQPGTARVDPGRSGLGGSNSGVESRPSKPLVAGSNPVSRSIILPSVFPPSRSPGGVRAAARSHRGRRRIGAGQVRLHLAYCLFFCVG